MSNEVRNLDAVINKIGYEIAEKIKNEGKDKNYIDKSLGVLANDGVYAYFVYVKSKKSKKIDSIFINELEEIAKLAGDFNNKETFFETLSNDLNQLLFFKETVEKALTYARYHAKVMDKK